jgi:Ca2+-binding RTX toxin-like protein
MARQSHIAASSYSVPRAASKFLRRSILLCAFCLVGIATAQGTAFAATVASASGTITYAAAAGEANNLTVSLVPGTAGPPSTVDQIRFKENGGVSVTPAPTGNTGPGPCVLSTSDLGSVDCPASGVTQITVNAGDSGDIVTISSAGPAPVPSSISTTLNGEAGNDTLTGGIGTDTLDGGLGADIMAGNGGIDTVTYQGRTTPIVAHIDGNNTNGADTTTPVPDGVADEGDTIGTDIENLIGGNGNDALTGNNSADNLLKGGPGDDTLDGKLGNDTLNGGDGADTLIGGFGSGALDPGSDTASFSDDTNAVTASLVTGTATVMGQPQDTLDGIENLTGGSGADVLSGDGSDNVLKGGNGSDTLNGNAGNDTLNGETGNDSGGTAGLFGGSGADSLTGDTGDDLLDGGDGNDITVDGGDGNDTLIGGTGNETLIGGNGTDTASYSGTPGPTGVQVDLAIVSPTPQNTGPAGTDTLSGIENLTGGDFNDTLNGDSAANTLTGGDGDDNLKGRDGADPLVGGNGSDTADFSDASVAVNANLRTGVTTGTGGTGDTLTGIENLTGGSADDTLNGDSGPNILDGGPGTGDTAAFVGNSSGVIVNLTAGTATGDGADILTHIENLTGGSGDDTLGSSNGDNVLNGGTAGNDTVSYATAPSSVQVDLSVTSPTSQNTIGAGTDTLANIDNVTGGNSNDKLISSSSANAIDGGGGVDTASFEHATTTVNANLRTGQASGDGTDTLSHVENLTGGTGNDTLVSDSANNVLDGGSGTDTVSFAGNSSGVNANLATGMSTGDGTDTLTAIESLTGGTGDDTLVSSPQNNVLAGGDGNDTVSFEAATSGVMATMTSATGDGSDSLSGIENLTGSAFADTLAGDATANTLIGNDGNDTIQGNDDADHVLGGAGVDNLRGGAGNDVIDGGSGNDTNLGGGTGVINGGPGNDTLTGGSGDDALEGGDGNDALDGGQGADLLDGEGGSDTAGFSDSSSVTANLVVGTGVDNVTNETDTLLGIENLEGTSGADTLTGNNAANTLNGNDGGDTLTGGLGQDVVNGGAGDDTLNLRDGAADLGDCGGGTADLANVDTGNIDTADNCEKVDIDGSPVVTILTGPLDPTPTKNNQPTFTFESNEAGSTFQCRIGSGTDPGTPTACDSGSFTPPALTDGSYTFKVSATDVGGATGSEATRSFTVDTTAPAVTIDSGPSGTTTHTTSTFTFSSTDGTATFTCAIDAVSPAACSGPGQSHTASVSQGSHTFRVTATDAAGNSTTASRSFTVDSVGPETTITSVAVKRAKHKATFGFASSEAGSTFLCKIDSGAFASCSSPKTYRHLTTGKHRFQVEAIDAAGNVDATPATKSFRI